MLAAVGVWLYGGTHRENLIAPRGRHCGRPGHGAGCGGSFFHTGRIVISTYSLQAGQLLAGDGFIPAERMAGATWIDLLRPTVEEELHVEGLLGCELPTREEMREIEDSRRLVARADALLMTTSVMVQSESEYPRVDDVTFILTPHCLVTVRYAEPRAFSLYAGRALADAASCEDGERALSGLLETLLERIADHIERVSDDLDQMVHAVLAPEEGARRTGPLDYAGMLRRLERNQTLIARSRASLMGLSRICRFLARTELEDRLTSSTRSRLRTLQGDTHSLMEHTGFLANNISFELAAILGMVNIEQNGIIKFFSVVSVVFLPPTLVASLYGMNFDLIPELHWHFGYPWALLLMALSAVLPYAWFRRLGFL